MDQFWGFINDSLTNILIVILSVLSIFEVLDMYGVDIKFLSYSKRKKQKEKEKIEAIIHQYMDAEKNLFRTNIQQYIGYILAELGLKNRKKELLTTIEELKNANCVIKTRQDMHKQLDELLSNKDIVVNLNRADPDRHVIYPDLKYYINFSDVMNKTALSERISSVLHFLVKEFLNSNNITEKNIDKIVIPVGSNILLGLRIANLLGVDPIIMQNKRRRIYEDQYWDGVVEKDDRVIIVHDVLYSGVNIINAIHHLGSHCHVIGVVSLVARTDNYTSNQGLKDIEDMGVPVWCALKINDDYLNNLFEQIEK